MTVNLIPRSDTILTTYAESVIKGIGIFRREMVQSYFPVIVEKV